MGDDSTDESDSDWKGDAIENASEKAREELDRKQEENSGKKSEAAEKGKGLVDKAEETLKDAVNDDSESRENSQEN